LEPFHGTNPTKKFQLRECVSDSEELSEGAACLLADADGRIDKGDLEGATDIYRFIVSSEEFGGPDRLAAGQKLYALAESQSDEVMREEALIRLVASRSLPDSQLGPAKRTLVSMALKRDERPLAITRLEDVVSSDPADAQSLANLAILMRQEGIIGADERMIAAIAARESAGEAVPQGWRDFVSS
ncbi:MAG: hypothetical protein AAGK02_15120, partial [Pseudomonadota bacterium]